MITPRLATMLRATRATRAMARVCGVCLVAAWMPAGAAGDGLTALFEDGSVVRGEAVEGWDHDDARPTLGGRALLDPANPVRLLARAGREAALAPPYIRFDNGDVLAGRVTAHEPDRGGDGGALVVALDEGPLRGVGGDAQRVRVAAHRVTAIAWTAETADAADGGARLRFLGGRELSVEALDYTAEGVRALSGGQVTLASFDELALMIPPRAPATADAALAAEQVPGLGAGDRAAAVLLSDGSVLGFAVDQVRRRGEGEGEKRVVWHAVQPVWARQPLAYRVSDAAAWSWRRGDQADLSRMPARLVHQRSAVGYAWPWRRDRSALGGMLAVEALASPRGVGMHADAAVAFELPDAATSVDGWVGIDRAAGAGGFARAAVHLEHHPRVAGDPAWRSDRLRGGLPAKRFGPIRRDGASWVILLADDAHGEHPPDADPLNIRDHVNWLSPRLTTRDAPRLPQLLEPRLRGWQIEGSLVIGRAYDGRAKTWRPTLHTDRRGLVLRREAHLGAATALLEVIAATTGARGEHRLTLTIDGQAVPWDQGRETLKLSALRAGDAPLAARSGLDAWHGRKATLELTITQPRDRAALDTPGLMLSALWLRGVAADRPGPAGHAPGAPSDAAQRRPDRSGSHAAVNHRSRRNRGFGTINP